MLKKITIRFFSFSIRKQFYKSLGIREKITFRPNKIDMVINDVDDEKYLRIITVLEFYPGAKIIKVEKLKSDLELFLEEQKCERVKRFLLWILLLLAMLIGVFGMLFLIFNFTSKLAFGI